MILKLKVTNFAVFTKIVKLKNEPHGIIEHIDTHSLNLCAPMFLYACVGKRPIPASLPVPLSFQKPVHIARKFSTK